jgi:prolipoprotein diacylglyceryltransferase
MHLQVITWDVSPEIFRIGSFAVRWYGLLFASSFFFGWIMMNRIFKNEKIGEEVLDRLTIYMILGTIIGARLGHCLFYEPMDYLRNPLEIFSLFFREIPQSGKNAYRSAVACKPAMPYHQDF